MQTSRLPIFSHLAGGSGIGFAAAILGFNLILVPTGAPTPGAGSAAAVDFYSSSAAAGLLTWAGALIPVAWALSTLFCVGALSVLRNRRNTPWALVGFCGVLAQNVTFTAIVAVRMAMTAANEHIGAELVWSLHESLFALNGVFLALAMLGFTTAGREAGLLGRWHAALGFCGAALQFMGACLALPLAQGHGALGLFGLAGWLIWVIWLVIYGIRLLHTTNPLSNQTS